MPAPPYQTAEIVYETRQLLCTLFGGGFLRSGDYVLVSAMEHNAVMRPLVQLAQHGVSFSRIPCTQDGQLQSDKMEQLLTPQTKASA